MANQTIRDIHKKYLRTSDLVGFLREAKEAGVTLDQVAEQMASLEAERAVSLDAHRRTLAAAVDHAVSVVAAAMRGR